MIKVKYFQGNEDELKKIEKGDWVDLRCYGANLVTIENKIGCTYNDKPLLERKTSKQSMIIRDGYFRNEKGIIEEVRYFTYRKGDYMMLDLGIAMELPTSHEAYVLPRGSSYKSFTILQTNSKGVVDESYKGDNDKWFMPVLAMEDGFIMIGERVCQFRTMKKMEDISFIKVDKLENDDRGGHGTTGTL